MNNEQVVTPRPTQAEERGPDNPVSKDYPEDGSCPYCGANNWGLDCGVQYCVECGNYD